MAKLIDVRKLDQSTRDEFAKRLQIAADFNMPKLAYWNSDPCRKHRVKDGKPNDKPEPGCQTCGIIFRKHQRIGIMWLYVKGRGLLADTVGSGKTPTAAGLIAILKEMGELDEIGRVLICVRPAAMLQWQTQLQRMLPTMNIAVATGTKNQRFEQYAGHWDVLLVGPQILLNDEDILSNFDFCAVIADDIDALRHYETRTACALKRIGRRAPRMVIMSGTPLQKRLHELHSVLEPLGGLQVFGSRSRFEKKYILTDNVSIRARGRRIVKREIVGYRDLNEFSRLIAPMALRRTADDIDDVNLPAIAPPNKVFLDLYPAQEEKYQELREGVMNIVKAGSRNVTRVKVESNLHKGAQICGGLALLGEADGPGTSVKLDWVMDKLCGDLSEEKVVVFAYYQAAVAALQNRCQAAGIDSVTIWGVENDKALRQARIDKFWRNPNCKVLIGTTAIEQSLNLQCARHIICFDMLRNPARMEQIVGRIRRDGSAFHTIYVHYLLTNRTQESRYLPLLEAEQALLNTVWEEDSALFDKLDPMKLAALITG